MTGLAVRFFIIAVIVVGGIVFRDRLTGGAGDLKVGDCFDTKDETTVKEVQHHPCDESHNAEVVLVASYPAAKGAAYPNDSDLDDWATRTCVPAIFSYVGPAADFDSLNYGLFYPKADDWSDGERQMTCYVLRLDMGSMSRSLRSAAQ